MKLKKPLEPEWWIFEEAPSFSYLGGGFKKLLFSPLLGENFQFDSYFPDGLKPPTSYSQI